MTTEMIHTMPTLVRRAEGLPAGFSMPILPWLLDPRYEQPGRLGPMPVVPPPARPWIHRIAAALSGLGAAIATGAGLMLLASYLATPG